MVGQRKVVIGLLLQECASDERAGKQGALATGGVEKLDESCSLEGFVQRAAKGVENKGEGKGIIQQCSPNGGNYKKRNFTKDMC